MSALDVFLGFPDLAAERFTATIGASVLTNGVTVFTVAGGPILISHLISECVTTCSAAAATLQWQADGTVGAAATFTGATASLANFAAGGMIVISTADLTTAPSITGVNGVVVGNPSALRILVPAGVIKTVVASGPTTGTFVHCLRWRPLRPGTTVTAAF